MRVVEGQWVIIGGGTGMVEEVGAHLKILHSAGIVSRVRVRTMVVMGLVMLVMMGSGYYWNVA